MLSWAGARACSLRCAVVALLCALWTWSCSAQAGAVGSLDDAFVLRRPAWCSLPDATCDFFAAVRRSPENAAYVDFYLEAAGAGWVALGWSTSPDMYSADVVGCNRVVASSSSAAWHVLGVVDTWNHASSRINQPDPNTDGVIVHSVAYSDGRLSCNFSRIAAVMHSGMDLDLTDGPYYLLYGFRATIQTAGSQTHLQDHGASIPFVSSRPLDLLDASSQPSPAAQGSFSQPPPPSAAPEDYTVIARSPSGCEALACDRFFGVQVNADNTSYLDFYMEGNAQGWLALGFTLTPNMLDADVVGCVLEHRSLAIYNSYNQPRARLNGFDPSQAGMFVHFTDHSDGRVICSFSRFAGQINNDGSDFDLYDGAYYLLYGGGDTMGSTSSTRFPRHKVNPLVSSERVDLSPALIRPTEVSSSTLLPDRLIKAHGILMILAWPVLAVTAIFFAAWMRPALPNGEWFQVHRAFMLGSLFLGAVGFILAFVASKDESPRGLIDLSNAGNRAHLAVGLILMTLAAINPILAVFRCGSQSRHRWLFNAAHGKLLGYLTITLALTNTGLGVSMVATSSSALWVYLAFLLLLISLVAVLCVTMVIQPLVVNAVDRKAVPSSLTHHFASLLPSFTYIKHGPLHTTPPGNAAPRDTARRWMVLTVFLVTTAISMTTVIVLVATD